MVDEDNGEVVELVKVIKKLMLILLQKWKKIKRVSKRKEDQVFQTKSRSLTPEKILLERGKCLRDLVLRKVKLLKKILKVSLSEGKRKNKERIWHERKGMEY